MDCERWQEARTLLKEVLDRDPEEWEAFLERVGTDDQDLQGEVRGLLEAHLEAGNFLGGPAEGSCEEISEARQGCLEDRRIGAYRVVRRVGKGGMGEVYLAVRADAEFEKRVALKLLKPGMDTDEVTRRFRTERQILAALDHPNIAKLLDGGTTPEGLPYIVMEYVEGKPIDEYCDDNGLSTRQRLELFCTVCSAVHYAHRNLVVHRDLKPNNILVTSEGVPKLLDFGVAKLLNPELSSPRLAPTATVLRLMTPDYASPEQARGEPVTTAADVYSLGMLLYYLLTGHRAYRVESRSPVEMLRMICEQKPETPSAVVMHEETAAGPDGGTSSLTPVSVSRSREGTPAKLRRRLSGDLDNIVLKALRKEPARRYGSAEHFAEDIRRHLDGRPVLARKDSLTYRLGKFVRRHRIGVAVAATFVAACLGFGVIMAMQRVQIVEQRDRAEQVKGFLVELFEKTDPTSAVAESLTISEMLDRTAWRLETELKERPEVRAELMGILGGMYRRLSQLDKADRLLRASLQVRRELLGERHPEVSEGINQLARLLQDQADYQGAERLYRQAVEMRSELLGSNSVEVAASRHDLAGLLVVKGEYDRAEELYREALDIRRVGLGTEHTEVASTLQGLGLLLMKRGKFDDAEHYLRSSLDLRLKILGDDHPYTASSFIDLGSVLYRKGDLGAAEPLQLRAIEIFTERLGDAHPTTATAINNRALLLKTKGEYGQAEELYQQVLGLFRESLGEEHPNVAAAQSNLANALQVQGRLAEAKGLYRQALEINLKNFGESHPEVVDNRRRLANVLRLEGDYEEAENLLSPIVAFYRKLSPGEPQELARSLNALALTLTEAGKGGEAMPYLQEALAIRRRGEDQQQVASSLINMARALISSGNPEAAEPQIREAIEILAEAFPQGHWRNSFAGAVLGTCLAELGRYPQAEVALVEAYEDLANRVGSSSTYTLQALDYLVHLFEKWDRPKKAAEYRAMLRKSRASIEAGVGTE